MEKSIEKEAQRCSRRAFAGFSLGGIMGMFVGGAEIVDFYLKMRKKETIKTPLLTTLNTPHFKQYVYHTQSRTIGVLAGW